MEWTNIRKLKNTKLLEKIEKQFFVSLPLEYKNLVKVYNAGIPTLTKLSINENSYYVERLISVNEDDAPNILSAISWLEQSEEYLLMPIALDQDGNLFSIKIKGEKYSIVLVDFENGNQCFLADGLNEFLLMLEED